MSLRNDRQAQSPSAVKQREVKAEGGTKKTNRIEQNSNRDIDSVGRTVGSSR